MMVAMVCEIRRCRGHGASGRVSHVISRRPAGAAEALLSDLGDRTESAATTTRRPGSSSRSTQMWRPRTRPYYYAGDDPVNNSDPTGLWCILGHNPNGSCRGSAPFVNAWHKVDGAWDCLGSACYATKQGFANAVAGAHNSLNYVAGLPPVPAPYPCSDNGAYALGGQLPYLPLLLVPGAGEAEVFGAASATTEGGLSLDDLAASGMELDPSDTGGQLTVAGRAYAKAGEVFGPTSGGPAAINEAGQSALQAILFNPATTVETTQAGRFAGGLTFISPDGVGIVFSRDGTLQYFGRM